MRFDGASERFVAMPSAGGEGVLPAVHAIVIDPGNPQLLWLGVAVEGLTGFDAGRGQATKVALPAPAGKRAALTVYAVHRDGDGALWLGTDGAGLMRLDPGSGRATTMGAAQGIPPGAIHGVLPGRTGHLWLATGNEGPLTST